MERYAIGFVVHFPLLRCSWPVYSDARGRLVNFQDALLQEVVFDLWALATMQY
jgi:hypothetical protein